MEMVQKSGMYDDRLPGIRWRFPHQCAHWFGMTVLFGACAHLYKFQFTLPANPILCPHLANFPLRSYEKALIMKLYTQRSFGVVWKPWSKPAASAWWKTKRLLTYGGLPLHTDGWD